MMILVVGDGPRDQSALPNLVCRILEANVDTEYNDWHDIRYLKGKGSIYARKLKYLTRRARADDFVALAIVVDTDKSQRKDKLRELREGREDDRQQNPPFPTAVGEANPHFDVWLLDDAVAVRDALGLAGDCQIPNAIKIDNPKAALTELINQSEIEFEHVSDALAEIAQRLTVNRCVHHKETGFGDFEQDVRDEIKPALSE